MVCLGSSLIGLNVQTLFSPLTSYKLNQRTMNFSGLNKLNEFITEILH
jgi:hypothetical protein